MIIGTDQISTCSDLTTALPWAVLSIFSVFNPCGVALSISEWTFRLLRSTLRRYPQVGKLTWTRSRSRSSFLVLLQLSISRECESF